MQARLGGPRRAIQPVGNQRYSRLKISATEEEERAGIYFMELRGYGTTKSYKVHAWVVYDAWVGYRQQANLLGWIDIYL